MYNVGMEDRPQTDFEGEPSRSPSKLPFLWRLWRADLSQALEQRDRLTRILLVVFAVVIFIMIVRRL